MAPGLYLVRPVCVQLYSEMNQLRFREICRLVILVRVRRLSMLVRAKIYRDRRCLFWTPDLLRQLYFHKCEKLLPCDQMWLWFHAGALLPSIMVPLPPAVSHGGSCHLLPLPVPSWEQFDIVDLCLSICLRHQNPLVAPWWLRTGFVWSSSVISSRILVKLKTSLNFFLIFSVYY